MVYTVGICVCDAESPPHAITNRRPSRSGEFLRLLPPRGTRRWAIAPKWWAVLDRSSGCPPFGSLPQPFSELWIAQPANVFLPGTLFYLLLTRAVWLLSVLG